MVVVTTGCFTGTSTTTPRTATEQALLTASAEAAIAKFEEHPIYFYKRFVFASQPTATETISDGDRVSRIDRYGPPEFVAYERDFILSELRLRFLRHGMHAVDRREDADVIVYPRAAVAAIDEDKFLIGIPSIPLPIPSGEVGGAVIKTPELALFRRNEQIGRARLGVYGVDARDGTLAFDLGIVSENRNYVTWTILTLINFSTTNLEEPYREKAKQDDQGK